MPLTNNLKPRETHIVNAVVLENSGQVAIILVHNTASLLREKDIITEEQADTPARRIYFAIQCQYLFPAKSDVYLPLIYKFLREFEAAAPSTTGLVLDIRQHVDDGQYYRALKSAKHLIAREQEILNDVSRKGLPAHTGTR
jgi:flagellar protein FlbT